MAASAHDDAGALEVTLGGGLHVLTPFGRLEGANLHSGRAEVAFARMAMEAGRRVSREALADAIWDDHWPASWESALRNVIVTLRRWLGTAGLDGAAILRTVTDGYRLALPAEPVPPLSLVHRLRARGPPAHRVRRRSRKRDRLEGARDAARREDARLMGGRERDDPACAAAPGRHGRLAVGSKP